ncbi:MAG: UbiA family prenyltransferase [Legionella sp.]
MHQWLKNVLLFVPILAAHQLTNIHTWTLLIAAFFAFSLCASSVYVINDLLDLENDRRHPSKCKRPFASGAVPTWVGALLAPLLFACSMGLATGVGRHFLWCLIFYFLITSAYALRLKRYVLIDCLTLSLLYTIRIVAGSVAANVTLSFWLLAFSVFLFLSLAFVKRYAEFTIQNGEHKLSGR